MGKTNIDTGHSIGSPDSLAVGGPQNVFVSHLQSLSCHKDWISREESCQILQKAFLF